MAEIKIEKKKPVWPWILVGLLILGVILYFVFANDDDDTGAMDDDYNNEQVRDTTYRDNQTGNTTTYGENQMGEGQNAVSRYISHVGDRSRMGIEHEYTNNALLHLIDAVEAKSREHNVDLDADLRQIREDARQITENPQATNHADKIKNAGTKIADAIEKIQEERFPNLSDDVDEVRSAAQEIDTSVLTLEQRETINSFFQEAADVLRSMS